MTTIYLSSTYEDLKDHRAAVFDALRRSGHEVIAMEDYVARDDRPLKACLGDVDRADIYVGLFAFRYGYIPPREHGNPDGRSITELEFRRADDSPKRPCFVFLLDEKAHWPNEFNDAWTSEEDGGARIRRFRNELRREKLAPSFSGPHELASDVQATISKHLSSKPGPADQPEGDETAITWDVAEKGSPYPGLLHYTRRFAPVYFGRDLEVRELLDRLTLPQGRLVIVSGDSGCGKSSLVEAGVLPRLEKADSGGKAIEVVRMVPSVGEDAFDALMRALRPFAEHAGLNDYALGRDLAVGRAETTTLLGEVLAGGLKAEELLLFLDQMEELFTARNGDRGLASRFLSGLFAATQTLPFRVIATIRGDLLHHCHAHPDMLAVLKGPGHYPLGRAEPYMLHDMIVHPARCAGVDVPESLIRRLIEDAGTEPGNLPLLGFVLRRLFDQRQDHALSEKSYKKLGGLTGAIAEHVIEVEHGLMKDLGRKAFEARLASLFESLVRVDLEGLPTRRRARRAALSDGLDPVVEALIKARLLTGEKEGGQSIVSVAHERLFEAWPALERWVAEHQDDLRLLRQAGLEAAEWHRNQHDVDYLWQPDRLRRLQKVIEGLPEDRADDRLRAFAWPQRQLIRLLDDAAMRHDDRDTIGHYLAALGDPRPGVGVREDGTPDIDWVAIPGGKVKLKGKFLKSRIAPFHMARYLVTNAQFQAFVDDGDGYTNPDWWKDMPADANDGPGDSRWAGPNRPRETVSWYEAVAFCRWLSRRLGFEVRLPIETEWQLAATGGDPGNVYPWGSDWDPQCCNTVESGLNRTTAVGLYPSGASAQGVMDLSGNLFERCLNKYESPGDTGIDDSGGSRVLRGGSWVVNRGGARADGRGSFHPDFRGDGLGFRVVCASPIR